MADDLRLDAYLAAQRRVAELVGRPGVDPATPVPACPGWDVQALVAHLGGLAVDVVEGNTERYGSRRWTAEQVASRAGRPLGRLLEEWAEAAGRLDQVTLPPHLQMFGSLGNLVLVDLAVHEHDLRGALDAPERDNETARLGLAAAVALLHERLNPVQADGSVAALRLVTAAGDDWMVGSVSPGGSGGSGGPVVLTADAFELWRGLFGRRSREQVRELSWSADPGPFLDHWALPPTPFRDDALAY